MLCCVVLCCVIVVSVWVGGWLLLFGVGGWLFLVRVGGWLLLVWVGGGCLVGRLGVVALGLGRAVVVWLVGWGIACEIALRR